MSSENLKVKYLIQVSNTNERDNEPKFLTGLYGFGEMYSNGARAHFSPNTTHAIAFNSIKEAHKFIFYMLDSLDFDIKEKLTPFEYYVV